MTFRRPRIATVSQEFVYLVCLATLLLPTLLGPAAVASPATAQAPMAQPSGERAPSETSDRLPYEHHYEMAIAGTPVGDMSVRAYAGEDGNLVTETRLLMRFPQGGQVVETLVFERFVETPDGRPVSAEIAQGPADAPKRQRWTFTDEGIRAVELDPETREPVPGSERLLPAPEKPWLTPLATERRQLEALARGADSISYHYLNATMGPEPRRAVWTKVGEEVVATVEGEIPATVWNRVIEGEQGPATRLWVDENARPLRTEVGSGAQRAIITLVAAPGEGDAEKPAGEEEAAVPGVQAAGFPGYESLTAEDGELLEPRETHYVVKLFGAPAGKATVRIDKDEAGNWLTEDSIAFEMRRGDDVINVGLYSSCIEAPDFRPLSCTTLSALGAQPTARFFSFEEDGTHIYSIDPETEEVSAEPIRTLPPFDVSWAGPAGSAVLTLKGLREGSERFAHHVYEPVEREEDLVFFPREKVREEVVDTAEGPIPTTVWRLPTLGESIAGGEAAEGTRHLEWLDSEGRMIRTEIVEAGFQMEMEIAGRAGEGSVGEDPKAAAELPDIMALSLVRPDRPIPRPRRAETAIYRLRTPGGTLTDLPQAGGQRSRRTEDGHIEVTVSGEGVSDEPGEEPPTDEELPTYLESSNFIDHESDAVRDLLARASRRWQTDGEIQATETDKARELRGFVHAYVSGKDLSTGFAAASTVVETRVGDCTEHAVLLAALLRAEGIPARVVAGLLYLPSFLGESNVFGYHMWTQALLPAAGNTERAWVDLDPMLLQDFDAAHIALSTSPLNTTRDLPEMTSVILTVFGELEIEVVSASTDG